MFKRSGIYGIKYEFYPITMRPDFGVTKSIFFDSFENAMKYKSYLLDINVSILKEGWAEFAENGLLIIP